MSIRGHTASVEYEEAKLRGWVCVSFPKAAESEKEAANQDFLEWQSRQRVRAK